MERLDIYYKNGIPEPASKFYFLKYILSRVKCRHYHYLDRDDRYQIYFDGLENKSDIERLLDDKGYKCEFADYERGHILELIRPACKSVMENLGFYISDDYSLMYFVHTILTSLFLDWEAQLEFFKYMVKVSEENVKAYRTLRKTNQLSKSQE